MMAAPDDAVLCEIVTACPITLRMGNATLQEGTALLLYPEHGDVVFFVLKDGKRLYVRAVLP